jgi:hypothetical protein
MDRQGIRKEIAPDIFILKLVFCPCFSFSFFVFFLSLSRRNLINCLSFLSFTVLVLCPMSEGLLLTFYILFLFCVFYLCRCFIFCVERKT